ARAPREEREPRAARPPREERAPRPARAPRQDREESEELVSSGSPVVEDLAPEWNGPMPSFLSFGAS
ncbi:MAG: ATP-dependent helicase, partial [Sphingomicrobium sp.]